MNSIYMVGNTHFDPVWLWRWDEGMASIHSTFRSALDRMNEDSEFCYSFDAPPVFEWIKKTDPEMFEEIKKRVSEGRWELAEGWWIQPDCFSGSGESYVRQGLYAQRYLMENFGRYSDTVFNVDSFGHSAMLPQILKKSHIDYYCMCRPEDRHYTLSEPYFNWTSADGSSVRAFRVGEYGEYCSKNMIKTVNDAEDKMKNIDCDVIIVYGVTNHGGAPTKKAISDIHSINSKKPYDIKLSTVNAYFRAQKAPKTTVNGEMLTHDFGVYTNGHKIKKRNRIAEYAALNAERSALIAKNELGKEYPKNKLESIWHDILFNQFHDILGGSSIMDAFTDAYNQQGRAIFTAEEIKCFSLQAVTHSIKMIGKNPDNPWNIVVWNLNGSNFDGYIEAEIQWLHEFPAYSEGIYLEDSNGKKYDCQLIRELSVIPGFRSRFVFRAQIPSMGYKVFKTVLTHKKENAFSCFTETPTFCFSVNKETGALTEVFDKRLNKVIAKNVLVPVCYEDSGDTWCFNIDSYGKRLEDFTLYETKVTEQGIHRTTFKTVSYFRKSKLEMYYTFYNDADYFDVRYRVNWNEKHTVLKLKTDTAYTSLAVSTPYGSTEREDNKCDAPMGEWACMHDNCNGIAFISDSTFSYTKDKTVLELSVLRSPIFGDLRMGELDDEADYEIMDNGISDGRIRVASYIGKWEDNRIFERSEAFNNPPYVIDEANHEGILPPTKQYLSLNGTNVSVGAVKECEDGSNAVVRLCEYGGKSEKAVFFAFGNTYTVEMGKHEIKTLKINGKEIKEIYMTEEEII